MKVVFFIILLLLIPVLVQGQVGEITESEFLARETAAAKLIEQSTYKMVRRLEYFEDREKPGRLAESHLKEVLRPNKWRTVDQTDYDGKAKRDERIWDGKSLYVRSNGEAWQRYDGGTSSGTRIESGRVTKKFKYLGKSELDGLPMEMFEIESIRIANKFSATDMAVVRYLRKTRFWFTIEGKLVKKIEDTTIEGRNALSRETIEFQDDPKLVIEAPIK